MTNRKLVRPNLQEFKEKFNGSTMLQEQPERSKEHSREPRGKPSRGKESHHAGSRRRPVPPELTNAEAFYYLKQMNTKTAVVVELDNGDKLRGIIEWYDRQCLKINRDDGPNLLVFKHSIRYLYKQEEEA